VRARAAIVSLAIGLGLATAGCDGLPGKPKPSDQQPLPSQVMAFGALYGTNCAGCHGTDGRLGASRPLNDPVYLALVPRERVRRVIAEGVPGTLQPAFGAVAGGSLTDPQMDALVSGIFDKWGKSAKSDVTGLPPYATAPGDAARGQAVYTTACAACHGPEGKGDPKGGAVADPSYLALVSDQYLRTTVIAGRSDLGMPDWRGYTPNQPLSEGQVSDVVAWLAAQRRPVPGRILPMKGS